MVSATVGGARYGVVLLGCRGAFFEFVLSEGIARWQLATGQTVVEGWAAYLEVGEAYFVYLVLWTVAVSAALTNAWAWASPASPAASCLNPGAVAHGLIGSLLVWVGKCARFEKLMKALVGVMGWHHNLRQPR